MEYHGLERQYESLRDNLNITKVQYSELLKIYGNTDAERKDLQNIIFRKFGVIHEDLSPRCDGVEFKPIRTAHKTAREVMRDMRDDDRKRLKDLTPKEQ